MWEFISRYGSDDDDEGDGDEDGKEAACGGISDATTAGGRGEAAAKTGR